MLVLMMVMLVVVLVMVLVVMLVVILVLLEACTTPSREAASTRRESQDEASSSIPLVTHGTSFTMDNHLM